jgi:hypothetical protein
MALRMVGSPQVPEGLGSDAVAARQRGLQGMTPQ